MRILFTLIIACLAFSLNGQCISVQTDSIVCTSNGSFFVLFDVEGTGATGWVLEESNQTGPYNTDEIREAGPFFAAEVTLTWVDIDDPNCAFSRTFVRPQECSPTDPCFGFAALVSSEQDSLCTSTYFLEIVGGAGPYTVVLSDNNGAIIETQVLDANTPFAVFAGLASGTYVAVVTDNRDCTTDAVFTASAATGCGAISGRCWIDVNENGIREDNGDEVVSMRVLAVRGGVLVATTSTNSDGFYQFDQLPEGTYVLDFEPTGDLTPTLYQQGNDPTVDSDVLDAAGRTGDISVVANEVVENIDAGWVLPNCSLELTIQDASCGPGQDGSITATATGTAPFTYTWSNGATTQTIDNLAAGTYTVVMTDAAGCVSVASGRVETPGRLRLSLQEIGSGCDGGAGTTHFLRPIVSGGTEPYSYEYFVDGEVVSTEAIFPNPVAGTTYVLVVTDTNGCTAEVAWTARGQTVSINWFAPFFLACDGSGVEISTGDSTDQYSYAWYTPSGDTLYGPTITATEVGTYFLRGTADANSCLIEGEALVLSSDLTADYQINLIDSLECGFGSCMFVTNSEPNVWRPDLTYTWTFPDGTSFTDINNHGAEICTELPGLYVLQIASLCDTITLTQLLEANLECSALNGTVYVDADADCGFDAGEIPAAGVIVEIRNVANNLVYYDITNADGQYGTDVRLGTYTVRPITEPTQPFGTCEPPTTATVLAGSPTTADAFLPVLVACPLLTTSISIPFLRRCFPGGAYVEYENVGSAVALDAQLTVTLDDFLIDAVANVTPSFRDGQTFVFDLGDLPPFAEGRIWFSFTISCEANIGQIHCIEAAITPDAPCTDPAGWNGALVNIESGTCNGDSLTFVIKNVGETDMSVPLSYVVVEDGIMMTPVPVVTEQLEAGELFTVTLPADGQTYQVVTNQEPNAPAADNPTALLEGCVTPADGMFSTGLANILPLGNGVPSQAIECRENRGAYDPNDKQGYPLGYGIDNNIEQGTRLTYAIRFQNTGTDTAFNVVIRDTISAALDLATFKPESASHAYTVDLDTNRVVTFTFANIMVPDSNVNLAASQGVVNFSIEHAAGLNPGDEIKNMAAIYFDFNEPIITNTSKHQIAKEPLPTGVRQVQAREVNLSVFPNPNNGLLQLLVANGDVERTDGLSVTDLYGRTVARTTYGQLGRSWDVRHLPAGYYLLVVTDPSGRAKGRTGFVLTK